MAGTLYACSINDMRYFTEDYEHKFVVSRKYPYNSLDELRAHGWDWLYHLAPNKSLYDEAMRAKKAGIYNKNYFDKYYTPTYNKQLNERKSLEELTKIINLLLSGKDVVIACWCQSRDTCHTKLIAQQYLNIGGKVALMEKGSLRTY